MSVEDKAMGSETGQLMWWLIPHRNIGAYANQHYIWKHCTCLAQWSQNLHSQCLQCASSFLLLWSFDPHSGSPVSTFTCFQWAVFPNVVFIHLEQIFQWSAVSNPAHISIECYNMHMAVYIHYNDCLWWLLSIMQLACNNIFFAASLRWDQCNSNTQECAQQELMQCAICPINLYYHRELPPYRTSGGTSQCYTV